MNGGTSPIKTILLFGLACVAIPAESLRAQDDVATAIARIESFRIPHRQVLGASTIGLLGSPLGQGPILAATTLPPGKTNGPDAAHLALPELMQRLRVPGVSMAVIKDFKVHWAKGYGVADVET